MIHLRHLIWDDWNVSHIARHGVAQDEVDEVCHGHPITLRESYKNRLVLLGETQAGKVLAVVLGPFPDAPEGTFYPFTARPAHRSERRAYLEMRGESTS